MANIRDYAEYLEVLWGLWCQLRAARDQGADCQFVSDALGRGVLFSAAQIASFDDIMDTVRGEGLAILATGGTRALDGEIIPAKYEAWYE